MKNRKEGFRAGLGQLAIPLIAIGLLVIFNLTYHPDASMASLIRITKYLTLLVAFLYLFMRKYIYLMIVTVNLNLRSLIQNAWLLVFIGIFRNFFSGLANLIIWIGAYLLIMAVHPFFEILFLGLLIYSFTNFLSISACYPLIDKYLVQPIKEMQDAAAVQISAEPDSDGPEG